MPYKIVVRINILCAQGIKKIICMDFGFVDFRLCNMFFFNSAVLLCRKSKKSHLSEQKLKPPNTSDDSSQTWTRSWVHTLSALCCLRTSSASVHICPLRATCGTITARLHIQVCFQARSRQSIRIIVGRRSHFLTALYRTFF